MVDCVEDIFDMLIDLWVGLNFFGMYVLCIEFWGSRIVFNIEIL